MDATSEPVEKAIARPIISLMIPNIKRTQNDCCR